MSTVNDSAGLVQRSPHPTKWANAEGVQPAPTQRTGFGGPVVDLLERWVRPGAIARREAEAARTLWLGLLAHHGVTATDFYSPDELKKLPIDFFGDPNAHYLVFIERGVNLVPGANEKQRPAISTEGWPVVLTAGTTLQGRSILVGATDRHNGFLRKTAEGELIRPTDPLLNPPLVIQDGTVLRDARVYGHGIIERSTLDHASGDGVRMPDANPLNGMLAMYGTHIADSTLVRTLSYIGFAADEIRNSVLTDCFLASNVANARGTRIQEIVDSQVTRANITRSLRSEGTTTLHE